MDKKNLLKEFYGKLDVIARYVEDAEKLKKSSRKLLEIYDGEGAFLTENTIAKGAVESIGAGLDIYKSCLLDDAKELSRGAMQLIFDSAEQKDPAKRI